MPPPRSTGNESNASTAVVNQAQQVSGMRISDIPRVRMFSNVVMKFSAPSNEPTQKIAMLMIQRFTPVPCPGRRFSERAQRCITGPSADRPDPFTSWRRR